MQPLTESVDDDLATRLAQRLAGPRLPADYMAWVAERFRRGVLTQP